MANNVKVVVTVNKNVIQAVVRSGTPGVPGPEGPEGPEGPQGEQGDPGPGGGGDVTGPATNTADFIPQWNGVDSKILKNGVMLDIDGTLAANSDIRIPSQRAVKTFGESNFISQIMTTDVDVNGFKIKSNTINRNIILDTFGSNGTIDFIQNSSFVAEILNNAAKGWFLKAQPTFSLGFRAGSGGTLDFLDGGGNRPMQLGVVTNAVDFTGLLRLDTSAKVQGLGNTLLEYQDDNAGFLEIRRTGSSKNIRFVNNASLFGLQLDPGGPSNSFISATNAGGSLILGAGAIFKDQINITATGGIFVSDTFFVTDGNNYRFGTSTGSKLGRTNLEKLAFFGASPIIQPAGVIDATGGVTVDAEARIAINNLLSRMRPLGLIAM